MSEDIRNLSGCENEREIIKNMQLSVRDMHMIQKLNDSTTQINESIDNFLYPEFEIAGLTTEQVKQERKRIFSIQSKNKQGIKELKSQLVDELTYANRKIKFDSFLAEGDNLGLKILQKFIDTFNLEHNEKTDIKTDRPKPSKKEKKKEKEEKELKDSIDRYRNLEEGPTTVVIDGNTYNITKGKFRPYKIIQNQLTEIDGEVRLNSKDLAKYSTIEVPIVNTVKKLFRNYKDFIKSFVENKTESNFNILINQLVNGDELKNYIELVLIKLIVLAKLLLTQEYGKDVEHPIIGLNDDLYQKLRLELIYFMLKFRQYLDNRQIILVKSNGETINSVSLLEFLQMGEELLSESEKKLHQFLVNLIGEYDLSLQKLQEVSGFNLTQLYNSNPELLFETRYETKISSSASDRDTINLSDYFIPEFETNIYLSQLSVLFDLDLASKITDSSIIIYKSLMGEGKTTIVTAIGSIIQKINSRRKPSEKKLKLIYCINSNLKATRLQVISNSKNYLNFAFNCLDSGRRIFLDYKTKRVLSNINDVDLIVTDVNQAVELLKDDIPSNTEFILFFDEPTFKLDEINIDNRYSQKLIELFTNLPKYTILASATISSETEFKNKLGNLIIQRDALTYPTEITNHRYSRFTISDSVPKIPNEMYNLNGIKYLPHYGASNIAELVSKLDYIFSNYFLAKMYSLNTLNSLYNMINPLIEGGLQPSFEEFLANPLQVNQLSIQQLVKTYLNQVIQSGSEELFNLTKDLELNLPLVNFSNLNLDDLITNYDKLGSQTLVVTSNPLQILAPTINDLFIKLINIFIDLVRDTDFKENLIRLKTSGNDGLREGLVLIIDRINAKKSWETIGKIFNTNPKIITLATNLKKFRKYEYKTYQVLLFFGIGIYDPANPNDDYQEKIVEYGQKGYFKYIISNTNISYGTNFKFENIIIDNTCFTEPESHSINTLFQTFGRSGRIGRSYKSNIYIHDTIITQLNSYIYQNTHQSDDILLDQIITQSIQNIDEEIRKESEQVSSLGQAVAPIQGVFVPRESVVPREEVEERVINTDETDETKIQLQEGKYLLNYTHKIDNLPSFITRELGLESLSNIKNLGLENKFMADVVSGTKVDRTTNSPVTPSQLLNIVRSNIEIYNIPYPSTESIDDNFQSLIDSIPTNEEHYNSNYFPIPYKNNHLVYNLNVILTQIIKRIIINHSRDSTKLDDYKNNIYAWAFNGITSKYTMRSSSESDKIILIKRINKEETIIITCPPDSENIIYLEHPESTCRLTNNDVKNLLIINASVSNLISTAVNTLYLKDPAYTYVPRVFREEGLISYDSKSFYGPLMHCLYQIIVDSRLTSYSSVNKDFLNLSEYTINGIESIGIDNFQVIIKNFKSFIQTYYYNKIFNSENYPAMEDELKNFIDMKLVRDDIRKILYITNKDYLSIKVSKLTYSGKYRDLCIKLNTLNNYISGLAYNMTQLGYSFENSLYGFDLYKDLQGNDEININRRNFTIKPIPEGGSSFNTTYNLQEAITQKYLLTNRIKYFDNTELPYYFTVEIDLINETRLENSRFFEDTNIIKKLKPTNFDQITISKYTPKGIRTPNPTTTVNYTITDIIMLDLNDENPSESTFYSLNYRLDDENKFKWFMYKPDVIIPFDESETIENILGRLGPNNIPCFLTYKYFEYIHPSEKTIINRIEIRPEPVAVSEPGSRVLPPQIDECIQLNSDIVIPNVSVLSGDKLETFIRENLANTIGQLVNLVPESNKKTFLNYISRQLKSLKPTGEDIPYFEPRDNETQQYYDQIHIKSDPDNAQNAKAKTIDLVNYLLLRVIPKVYEYIPIPTELLGYLVQYIRSGKTNYGEHIDKSLEQIGLVYLRCKNQ